MRFFPFALIALASAAAADTPNLTGTYNGIVACDRTQEGRPGVFRLELDIRVLQKDRELYIATWAAEDESQIRKKASLYKGSAVVADGRVSGYASVCQPDFEYKELVRIYPAMPKEGALSFSADTVFVTENLPNREGELIVESCRWVMTRTSDETPEMRTCP